MASEIIQVAECPVPSGTPALSDADEVLLRHIRSAWYDNGVPSSQNFEPLPKDLSHLSVERASMISPQAAFVRWTGWRRDSVAVFGVTVGAFEAHGAPSYHVPVNDPGAENAEHALVTYSSVRAQAKKLASKIKKEAMKVYEPPTSNKIP